MNLYTGKRITHQKCWEIPITQGVITQVEHLGRKNGLQHTLTFMNRKQGHIQQDNSKDWIT